MTITRRLMMLLAAMLLMLSASGVALAQTDGPDPDSPIKLETPESDDGEAPDGDDVDAEEPADEDEDVEAGATPVAGGAVQLAAITLDSTYLPSEWLLIQESYTSPEDLIESLAGLISAEELEATGLAGFYDSYYINPATGNTVRTYAIEFETADGAAEGFALLEDEDRIAPNGSFTDLPGLEGIGDGPSEISTGTRANGDGTTTTSYDISFTIDRYEFGAAMETYDESDPDEELVEQMARDLAERAETVLGGGTVPGVIDDLPAQLVELDNEVTFEGYQTAVETFLIADPDDVPDGYVSGYVTGASYSGSQISVLPYITIGIATFESADDVEEAIESPDTIMPLFEELEEIEVDLLDGADNLLAFQFASVEGGGELDSVRIFLQIDDQLITIDVQGEEDVETALDVAEELAALQIACVLDDECGPAELQG